jgi:hypothetical protein
MFFAIISFVIILIILGGTEVERKRSLALPLTIWALSLAVIAFILIFPSTHKAFMSATAAHPYLMGFVKVSILATMGELLAVMISNGEFKLPKGIVYRFIIWGFLGMTFVIVFDLFANGVMGSMKKGILLPSIKTDSLSGKFIFAFFTSTFMNLAFAPTFMAFHRVTDTFIDLGEGKLSKIVKVKLSEVVKTIDWNGYIGFVVVTTIPIFWIPAHTITFMLPPEYRVLMAAFLSIALGAILATAKRKKSKQ